MIPDRLSSALSRSYRIERELGQGVMATVYLAEDLNTPARSRSKYGAWFLAPDGASVATLGGSRDVATLVRVPLRGGTITGLGKRPRSEGDVGLAGWSRDGVIHLTRTGPATGGTSLLGLDAATGALRSQVELPATCDPGSVSFASAGRRAACVVRERRADLMLIDGLRP